MTKTSWNIIQPDHYYRANGLEYLLLGAKTYLEADALYTAADESVRQAALPFIPLLESVRWSSTFMEAKAYVAEHGSLPKPLPENEKGEVAARVFTWIATQRSVNNSGKLSEARRALLDRDIPEWIGRNRRGGRGSREGTWEVQLMDYALFVRRNNHLPRSIGGDCAEELAATWMSNQKTHFKSGILSQERIALLSIFAPGWQERKRKRPDWDEAFSALKTFVADNNRLPSEVTGSEEELFLGAWMRRQKEDRTAKRDKRNAERVARMDRELPGWRVPLGESAWQHNFALVRDFVASNGRLPLFSKRLPDEIALARWLYSQKTSFHKRGIDPERATLLDNAAPGWSDKSDKNDTEVKVEQILTERLAVQEPSVTISMTSASAPYSPAR